MKIALVILHANTARGGAERYTLDLAGSLIRRGHDVSILASSFQSGDVAGQQVLLAAAGITRTGRYRSFLGAVDLHLGQVKYDVVHAMLPVRQCDVYHPHAGVAAETGGNLFESRRRLFAAVEKKLLTSQQPPVVLCLSDLIRDVLRRHYPGLTAEKLVSQFNGTDLRRFDPTVNSDARQVVRDRFKIADDAVVGLMLAQDFERKGLGQAIEGLAKSADRRLILLVGGRPDPTKYQRLAKSLGVSDRVIFAGHVPNPVEFYRAADFFVLPTRFDPCSLVVLEALTMGLPVISTVKNGACEIMQDGIHGRVLADPKDVAALAAAMNEMLDVNVRTAWSMACLSLRSSLSQEAHLDRLIAIYEHLM